MVKEVTTHSHRQFLGGPSSLLPRRLESFLSWSLCVSCLGVSGYHYCVAAFIKPLLSRIQLQIQMRMRIRISPAILGNRVTKRDIVKNASDEDHDTTDDDVQKLPFFQCWIPLTTHSRSELDRGTRLDRYHQLIQILLKYDFTEEKLATICNRIKILSRNSTLCADTLVNDRDFDHDHDGNDNSHVENDGHSPSRQKQLEPEMKKELDNLIQLFRENTICRHLASLVMRPYNDDDDDDDDDMNMTSWNQERFKLPLVNILASIWPRLLQLPNGTCTERESESKQKYAYEISMVIPAYAESAQMLEKQLLRSLVSCKSPRTVEIIIVDAGGNGKDRKDEIKLVVERDMTDTRCKNKEERTWGDVKVLTYTKGGGRGPCLNYGAAAANGRIITFCHMDTTLPTDWDSGISATIDSRLNGSRSNSCAFGFGIDTSPEGLSNGYTEKSKMYFPPGIRAVETTANIRTQLYSLPYGDQAISVAKDVFDFVGGFPDQCLMEDYELVSLLRKRSALIPKMCNFFDREELKIIPGEPALCSPRRWQKFGVLYVTFMNSKFVNLYSGGMTPDQLYKLYYGRDPPPRESELSPWEVTMSEISEISKHLDFDV